METALQRAVRTRAKNRCEYCLFPELFAELPFHVDHVISRQHGGPSELDNLALACCFCNSYKGPNLSGVDAESGQVARLFNPRESKWTEHFAWNGPWLVGRTPTGRATIQALRLNRADAVAVRQLLMRDNVYPWS
ncbi:MAG: HNH endonuclease signature motif containing protein [Verrucomicrobia bacterium]|nr:HNH endonuclease signature motif containing protein [Verrucomicrobiota bacterium]